MLKAATNVEKVKIWMLPAVLMFGASQCHHNSRKMHIDSIVSATSRCDAIVISIVSTT